MAPEVVLRKLETLRRLLRDLQPMAGASLETVAAEHYKVERILELLVTASADLLQHLLAERGIVAGSYKDVFRFAASEGLLDLPLATRLEEAAGMRNVLVHLYDEIDLRILHASIERALKDFAELVAAMIRFTDPPRNR
ncbi:MAG: DUF86 domain-containing protein [Acidobacteria bacterium]|nr:DUF86 domain-containing protein [Acidobacteriota bacterium]